MFARDTIYRYKSYNDAQKKQVKLFLYGAYYVDKYRFETVKK